MSRVWSHVGIRVHSVFVFYDGHRVKLGNHSTMNSCRASVKRPATLQARPQRVFFLVLARHPEGGSSNWRSWLQTERQGTSWQTRRENRKHARHIVRLLLDILQSTSPCVILQNPFVIPGVQICAECCEFVGQDKIVSAIGLNLDALILPMYSNKKKNIKWFDLIAGQN